MPADLLVRVSGTASTLTACGSVLEVVTAGARLLRGLTQASVAVVVSSVSDLPPAIGLSALDPDTELPGPDVIDELLTQAPPWLSHQSTAAVTEYARKLALVQVMATRCDPSLGACALMIGGPSVAWDDEVRLLIASLSLQLCLTVRGLTGPSRRRRRSALAVIDRSGRIAYMTRAAEQVTGLPRSRVQGLSPLLADDQLAGSASHRRLWDRMKSSGLYSGVLVSRDEAEAHPGVRMILAPVLDPAGRLHHVMGHYQALPGSSVKAKTSSDDERPADNRSQDGLAIAAVQMLRDPVACIETLSWLMTHEVTASTPVATLQALWQVRCATKELETRLPRVLSVVPLGGADPREKGRVDLSALLATMEAALSERLLRSNVRIVRHALPEVRGSQVLLRVLFENLLVVSLRRPGRRSPEITIRSMSTDRSGQGQVTLTVSDGADWRPLLDPDVGPARVGRQGPRGDWTSLVGAMLVKAVAQRHGWQVAGGCLPDGSPCLRFSIPPDGEDHVEHGAAAAAASCPGPNGQSVPTDLLTTLGHDLRSPASTIVSSVELLLDREGALMTPEQRCSLHRIHRNSTFMLELVEDLLQTLKLDSGLLSLHLSSRDLRAIVTDVLVRVQTQAALKSILLVTRMPDEPVLADIDQLKMNQVVQNLVTNGVKFTAAGGTVEVGVRQVPEGEVLWVHDTGLGIPDGEIDRLFKKFSRTSVRATRGEKSTGLGLYISSCIVHLHGWSIRVESVVGKGTIFEVLLPPPLDRSS